MVKIGILKESNGFDQTEWNLHTITPENIRSKVADLVDEKLFFNKNISSQSELFEQIQSYLNPLPHHILNITDLSYTSTYVIQAIYTSTPDKISSYNDLASQFTRTNIVDGIQILIKRDISSKGNPYVDFDKVDLQELIEKIFIKTAVVVNPSGEISLLSYIRDPLENLNIESTFKNIRFHEMKFLDYSLIFYVNINVERSENNLNTKCSTIYRQKIYGDVIISVCDNADDNPQSQSLNKDIFMKIYQLFGIEEELVLSKYSRQINFENNNLPVSEDLDSNAFPELNYAPNFYSIIDAEYSAKKNVLIKTNVDAFTLVLNDIV
jgi:hypothetical protein